MDFVMLDYWFVNRFVSISWCDKWPTTSKIFLNSGFITICDIVVDKAYNMTCKNVLIQTFPIKRPFLSKPKDQGFRHDSSVTVDYKDWNLNSSPDLIDKAIMVNAWSKKRSKIRKSSWIRILQLSQVCLRSWKRSWNSNNLVTTISLAISLETKNRMIS